MSLTPGTRLGSYEIVSLLGAATGSIWLDSTPLRYRQAPVAAFGPSSE